VRGGGHRGKRSPGSFKGEMQNKQKEWIQKNVRHRQSAITFDSDPVDVEILKKTEKKR